MHGYRNEWNKKKRKRERDHVLKSRYKSKTTSLSMRFTLFFVILCLCSNVWHTLCMVDCVHRSKKILPQSVRFSNLNLNHVKNSQTVFDFDFDLGSRSFSFYFSKWENQRKNHFDQRKHQIIRRNREKSYSAFNSTLLIQFPSINK